MTRPLTSFHFFHPFLLTFFFVLGEEVFLSVLCVENIFFQSRFAFLLY